MMFVTRVKSNSPMESQAIFPFIINLLSTKHHKILCISITFARTYGTNKSCDWCACSFACKCINFPKLTEPTNVTAVTTTTFAQTIRKFDSIRNVKLYTCHSQFNWIPKKVTSNGIYVERDTKVVFQALFSRNWLGFDDKVVFLLPVSLKC